MSDLPFDLQPEAAARWLEELESVPAKTRGRRLYAALKALNAATLPEMLRLALLEILRPSVVAASEILALDSLRFTPLPEAARNAAKLSAFLHHELAAGYERSLTGAAPVAGHRILASLGWMLVRILQLGEPLRSGVWRRLYAVYRQGETQGWLTQPVSEPLAGDLMETSKDRFKCAVMFVAISPMRFEPRLMSEVFVFLLQHCQHIELGDTPTADGWSIDPLLARGPRRADLTAETHGHLLYLSMHLPQTERTSPLLLRLRHHLGHPPAGAEYPVTRRVDELWRGRESIVTELRRRQSRSSPSNKGWLAVPEFELTPLENASSADHAPIFPTNSNSRIHRRLDALLRLNQNDPIAVLETESIGIRPGDLVVLKLLDETLLAAVVRWVKTSLQESKTKLGLDPIEGTVECVQALIAGQGPIQAIRIIDAHGETAVLVLAPLRLKPGDRIMFGDSETQVVRLLEWADDFCAYSLIQR